MSKNENVHEVYGSEVAILFRRLASLANSHDKIVVVSSVTKFRKNRQCKQRRQDGPRDNDKSHGEWNIIVARE